MRRAESTAGSLAALRACLLLVATAVACGGCAYYSFSPAVKTHISTIAIPVFTNETLEFGAEQDVTDAVIAQFSEKNLIINFKSYIIPI